MDNPEEIGQRANEAFGELKALMADIKENYSEERAAKADELAATVADLKQKQDEATAEQVKNDRMAALEERVAKFATDVRSPSKAAAILNERHEKASVVDNFFLALSIAQSGRSSSEQKALAEKALADMGSYWTTRPESSKAVLGETNGNGGYLAPRAVVAELTQVQSANNPYRRLLSVVTNVIGPTVEVPHIGLAPTRATVVARGATKTNVGMDVGVYTATFYTLAQIIDAGNQWLRQTRGQGEKVIRERLGKSIALGESYYILSGSGTSEPKGILTSIGASGTYVTTHTGTTTTIAGNFATAIAKASAALANRNRVPDGVVMNAGDFWTSLASGADTAGFFVAPEGGVATLDATGAFSNGAFAMNIWGLPVLADPNMTTDKLVVGQWKGAELYIGDDVRIDSSDVAGDRWDKNETGFRIEEEMAFNADPYVAAGLFQAILDVNP